jgi:hypothetical protein
MFFFSRSAVIQPNGSSRPLSLPRTWLKSGSVSAAPTTSPVS